MEKLGIILGIFMLGQSLVAKDIVVGVEFVPERQFALLFTPIILPDLFSAKAAFEFRLHDKINLIVPLETKYMDYGSAIRTVGKWAEAKGDFLAELNNPKNLWGLAWNFDF